MSLRLAVNIGNTHIKLAYCLNNKIYSKSYTHEVFSHNVLPFLDDISISDIIIASVVPGLTATVQDILQTKFNKNTKVLSHTDIPIDTSMYNTALVGIDRLLACYGYGSYPAIVFDLGTATTVNVIDNENKFLGGAILAGAKMQLHALAQKGAMLPEIGIKDVELIDNPIGDNTKAGIISGLVYGTASAIDGMAKKIQKKLGYKCNLVITGGFSIYIMPHLEGNYTHNEDLVIEGILKL